MSHKDNYVSHVHVICLYLLFILGVIYIVYRSTMEDKIIVHVQCLSCAPVMLLL